MRYCVQYEPDKNEKYPSVTTTNRKPGASLIICLLVLSALLVAVWYKDAIISWLVPGDDHVTIRAAEEMIGQLKDGVPVGEAVTVFCEEIIDNGR